MQIFCHFCHYFVTRKPLIFSKFDKSDKISAKLKKQGDADDGDYGTQYCAPRNGLTEEPV